CWVAGPGGGYNAVEARRGAPRLLGHFRSTPQMSLGGIAFRQRQAGRILAGVGVLPRGNPGLQTPFPEGRGEPVFLENLESVQGDERAVIFLSVGYGPDVNRRVAMRFGPLNRQGGERRLNVAVTRARERMVVVSSMRAEDIDLSRAPGVGPQLLRNFLD